MGKMPTSPVNPALAQFLKQSQPKPARPKGPPKLNNKTEIMAALERGMAAQKEGQLEHAEFHFQHVLRDHPKDPNALNLMGLLAVEGNLDGAAIHYLELAAKQAPNNDIILNNLANAYIKVHAERRAVPLLERALELSDGRFEILMNLARAKTQLGQAKEALELFERAMEKNAEDIHVRTGYGLALANAGELERSKKVFRDLIKEQPGFAYAYQQLSSIYKYQPDELDELSAIEALLEDDTVGEEDRMALHYAAGKIHNDSKRYDAAFPHFKRAKEIESRDYELEVFSKLVDEKIRFFTSDWFERNANVGSQSEKPIFIVGMPRSGTTLTEQILASHPDIYGGGELPDIHLIHERSSEFVAQSTQAPIKPQQIKKLTSEYLEQINKGGASASRVTDKMPHNFQHLGFIRLLFPNAHIIHCLRDPMDNCVSCFTNAFNTRHGYNADLETLGLYYQEYRRLMDHWNEVLPGRIFTMHYEETIRNQEAVSRELIEFVGMEWDNACLNFHQNDREVMTISKWQVRQPIYTSSVKRWKNYESHLEPLKNGLGDYFLP